MCSAIAYAIGAVAAWSAWRLGVPALPARARLRLWFGIAGIAAPVVPLALWLGGTWQADVLRAVAMPGTGGYVDVGVVAIAAVVFLALVGLARLIRESWRRIVRRLRVSIAVSRLASAGIVGVIAVLVLTGVLSRAAVSLADVGYASLDGGTDRGIYEPASALRSGSHASLVSWRSLGIRGRTFVASGPTAADIQRLTGRSAMEPIRVYAGTLSAGSFAAEANLVLEELERTGAFGRALLAMGTPPGEGGLDESLVEPLEYMYGGDTAVAAMQYSHLPSWVSFLFDESRARASSRILFDTVYKYWSKLPETRRPRLVVFGMSLGALGAADAFDGLSDLTARTSGALFVGTPVDTALWQRITAARAAGSPERLPVYGDGATARFAASAADLRSAGGTLLAPRVVFLQHASDPIVWWSQQLLWSDPQWLSEPRGPGVVDATRWYPLITFAQLTNDLRVGGNVPAGYGHHYAPAEVVTAWLAILHPPGWTDANTAALVASGR